MTTAPSASEYFGSMAAGYDSLIRRAVPRYDEMLARLLEYCPAATTRILELGCGTGNLTLLLARCFPAAAITTVDAAQEMTQLTTARAREAGYGERVTAVTSRFEDLAFQAGSFDLVASCMSLHHVREKAPLYQRFAAWLVPGGALCVADQFLGAAQEVQRRHWDLWLGFCREPGHCSEEELRSLIDHAAAHDHYEPLQAHFGYLLGAGFTSPDCAWRNGMYAVLTAERP
jgi:tRNA (cmo5U34)-methyltransferase